MAVSVASAPRTAAAAAAAAAAADPRSSTASWEGPLCNTNHKGRQ